MTIYEAAKRFNEYAKGASLRELRSKKYITQYTWSNQSKFDDHKENLIASSERCYSVDDADLTIIRFTDESIWNEPIGGCTQVKVVVLGPKQTKKLWEQINKDLQFEQDDHRCDICGGKIKHLYTGDSLGENGSFMLCNQEGSDKISINICLDCRLNLSMLITLLSKQEHGLEFVIRRRDDGK